MIKRILSIALVAMMLCLSSATVFAEEAKSTPEITMERLLEISRSEEGLLSRGAFAAMLVEAAGISEKEITEDANLPQDLKADAWYAKSVMALCDRDILKGSLENIYPDNAITGIEAITFIARVLGISEKDVVDDVEIKGLPKEHWGYAVYSAAVKEGLVLEDLDPLKALDSETAAKLLMGVFGTDRKVKDMFLEIDKKNEDIKSFRISGNMAIEMEMDGAEDLEVDGPIKTIASFNSEFGDNIIHQTVETMIPLVEETMKTEQYMDKEFIYTMISGLGEEDKWIKMKNPMSAIFDENFLSQQQALTGEIDELTHYRLLGTEKVDGEDCYKIAMYTRLDNISEIFGKMNIFGQQEQEALKEASDMLEDISMNGYIYVGVDDKLVKKALIDATISMNIADSKKESPVVLKAIKMNMDFNYKDYDADIEIEIPEEAKEAEILDLENLESLDDLQDKSK